ncbi:putative bifunctional diguanylate cyclase/phosphodiesterase [Alteriqipengyuania lutimaris]|uniref:EAL domain-containing protein n=1 Tax=Alteriqipengyuania lutimaris TaxID=1538146 RepID=A0A395LGP0_9SPHN|nr:EAL domain-containing protein [Alteriqipengyuania lutimaris]MBB3035162.1 diguanylate cyclase (GGDEF)-like protein [Alteriqipengyuania lutimaris]RDS75775.1 EAL domain-containing protein [Alteriqipengyuania lutimaris]
MGAPSEDTLRLYSKLDDGVQQSLDRVVEQCAEQFDCDASLVTMLEPARQGYLARTGAEISELPIEMSFCRHAVDQKSPLLIHDTHVDETFARNAIVTGAPFVRSYVGVPIRLKCGDYLGALCLVDSRPHRFGESHIAELLKHAATVEDLLRLHAVSVEAAELHARLETQNETLAKANRLWAQAASVAKIGAWEIEVESGTLHWSTEVFSIYGLEYGEVPPIEACIDHYHPKDRDMVYNAVTRAIDEGGSYAFDADLVAGDGTMKRVRSAGEYIGSDGERPARLVGVIQDISDSYRNELALRHAASHDSLTGMLNRAAFDRALKQRIGEIEPDCEFSSLVLLDLDGFKDLNDTFGHLTGDAILVEIAERLGAAAPARSIVARWGGDEFAVILPNYQIAGHARRAAERMLEAVKHCSRIGGRGFEISATAGMASIEKDLGPQETIRRADTALYHAKHTERGSLTVYSEAFDRMGAVRQQAIDEVREAITEGRMFAGYMPVVDLGSGKTVGFEALMRITSPEGIVQTAGEVAPALLDPIVSRKIDQHMLEMVAKETALLVSAFPDLSFISVNATEADLLSRDFASRFKSTFAQHQVDLGLIVLEVTETMLSVEKTDPIKSVLDELRRAGVSIALDDFGTGYSSLSHLRDFPIDKVKLDLSFVQGIESDNQSRTIVQAMIGMAKNMGISVIAEGIETQEQRNILKLMQCEYGQGYFYGKAASIMELGAFASGDAQAVG